MRRAGRSAALLVAAGLALALGPAPAAAQETWYAQTVTQSDVGFHVRHHWSKGRKLRVEMVVGTGNLIVTLVSGEWYYAVDAVRGQGLAIRRSARALAQDREGGRPFGRDADRLIEKGAEKIGSDTLGGQRCDLYQHTGADGRRQVCISTSAVPLLLRMETFDRTSGHNVRTDFLNWARDVDLPDAFFEPDPRWQLERLEYDDFARRAATGPVGSVPVLYGELLHGR